MTMTYGNKGPDQAQTSTWWHETRSQHDQTEPTCSAPLCLKHGGRQAPKQREETEPLSVHYSTAVLIFQIMEKTEI